MAEHILSLYVEVDGPEQIEIVNNIINKYCGPVENQDAIEDRYIVSDLVLGSEAEEAICSAMENLSNLNGVSDIRAYICGDEEPWECFYRVTDGSIIAKEHTPFEDDEIDLEEYKEGIYHWWHDGIVEGVKAGMLHEHINEILSKGPVRTDYEESLDISKFKDSEDSYVYFEFTSEELDTTKVRNRIKKEIKVVFDSFHISKTKSFKDKNHRYGFLFLGYIWPEVVTEILTHSFFYDIMSYLEGVGAEDIIVKLSHKEVELDELIIAKDQGPLKVFASSDGELTERKDLELAAALSEKLQQHLPYMEYKARLNIPTEGLFPVVEKYCSDNEILIPSALTRRWEGEQYVIVDYKFKKLYAVCTNDPKDIRGFLIKKNNEQNGESSLGVINMFTKQVCVFDSEFNFECHDIRE